MNTILKITALASLFLAGAAATLTAQNGNPPDNVPPPPPGEVPPPPPDMEGPEWEYIPLPDDLKDALVDHREARKDLREELRAQIDELENPTPEEVQEVVKAFREENAELLAVLREEGKALHEDVREFRKETGWVDGDVPPELRDQAGHVKDAAVALRESRREYMQAIREAETPEERMELIRQWREDQLDLRHDLKEERRELRRLARELRDDDLSGTERPDDF